jgi:8-oxo-dGTP pyrophosphatase MutT (NUDIX family)
MKVRKSARIVVLNTAGAVLLVRYHDPTPVNPSKPELFAYWVPPGGGVDEGESFERAAIRELEEETGIELSEVGPQIWSRERQLLHRGELKRYLERYFIAWAKPPRQLRNRTSEKIEEIRWWTLDELRASTETFLPEGFVELVAPVIVGDVPSAPIDII